jgi:homoserine O-acetyltransferase/O-succinyltransferase
MLKASILRREVFEAKYIPHAEVRPIPSIWGHMSPMNPDDQSFIDRALADALS